MLHNVSMSAEVLGALVQLGWKPHAPGLWRPEELAGRVTLQHGSSTEVAWIEDGGIRTGLVKLAKRIDPTPVAGDWVALAPDAGASTEPTITRVLPRSTVLRRADPDGRSEQVLATNIDLILVVLAADLQFNVKALERLSVMARDSGAAQLLVVTKAELSPDLQQLVAQARVAAPGVEVLSTSAVQGTGLEELRARLGPGVTATMFGASGAGKTSLLNSLEGRDELVAAVSRDGAGRHTTSTRKLYLLSSGGVLLDPPGIRNLDLLASDEALNETFVEIAELAAECRFRDCAHENEPGCAVLAAVAAGTLDPERLERMHAMQREMAFQESRVDPAKAAARRQKWKQISSGTKRERIDW
jgi:ribosome biogenesis GTPase